MFKDWDLWLCVIIYTVTFFWFGMWVQKKSDQWQLKKITDDVWTQGCRTCAKFEREKWLRDNTLFGAEEPHKIDENYNRGVKEGTGNDEPADGSNQAGGVSDNGSR